MAGQSRGLGRGLQALLSAQTRPAVAAAEVSGGTLPIAAIQAGDSQPRKSIQQPPLEGFALGLAGEADAWAGVACLALQRPEFALGDLPRRALIRAWKARSGPGVRIALWAASTRSPRACACPAREM